MSLPSNVQARRPLRYGNRLMGDLAHQYHECARPPSSAALPTIGATRNHFCGFALVCLLNLRQGFFLPQVLSSFSTTSVVIATSFPTLVWCVSNCHCHSDSAWLRPARAGSFVSLAPPSLSAVRQVPPVFQSTGIHSAHVAASPVQSSPETHFPSLPLHNSLKVDMARFAIASSAAVALAGFAALATAAVDPIVIKVQRSDRIWLLR